MKATGVIRRIDDLGRIVIPKEIRRNLKISEGDSLEIYVDSDSVVLKKYSFLDDIILMYKEIVDSFYKLYNKSVLITDGEKVIVSSKDCFKYLNKKITSNLKELIFNRIEYDDTNNIILDEKIDDKCFILPIIANSDALGSIILISNEIKEEDKKLIRLLSIILIKNIED